MKSCWREKEANEWKDLYGRERKDFYERRVEDIIKINREKGNIEEKIISRERGKLRCTEKGRKIKEARYKRYKVMLAEGVIPRPIEE